MTLNDVLLWGGIYAGVIVVAAWIAMVIWAYRDMQARSREAWLHVFMALVVLLLSLPGLLIYLLLRPRETLAEAYERSLEEEALLQEIEEKPTCPGCSQRIQENWQACPHCHTRLKKPCINCGQMLHLSWDLCPYCASVQTIGGQDSRAHVSRKVRRGGDTQPQEGMDAPARLSSAANAPTVEFTENEY
ncbi:MAG: zinc ribbon domain-containing protein [Phototrophicaceae bacterium]